MTNFEPVRVHFQKPVSALSKIKLSDSQDRARAGWIAQIPLKGKRLYAQL